MAAPDFRLCKTTQAGIGRGHTTAAPCACTSAPGPVRAAYSYARSSKSECHLLVLRAPAAPGQRGGEMFMALSRRASGTASRSQCMPPPWQSKASGGVDLLATDVWKPALVVSGSMIRKNLQPCDHGLGHPRTQRHEQSREQPSTTDSILDCSTLYASQSLGFRTRTRTSCQAILFLSAMQQ